MNFKPQKQDSVSFIRFINLLLIFFSVLVIETRFYFQPKLSNVFFFLSAVFGCFRGLAVIGLRVIWSTVNWPTDKSPTEESIENPVMTNCKLIRQDNLHKLDRLTVSTI